MTTSKVKFGLGSMSAMLQDRYSGIQDSNDQEAQKNALEKLYKDDEGNVCIPALALKACIREAAREIGKKMESKKRERAVRAGFYLTRSMYPVGKKEPDRIHAEHVTRKGTGNKVTRVVAYRPCIDNWEIECEAVLYDITPDFVRQAIELAGFKYGLLGHRPEYGRFKLTNFEVAK